MHEVVASNIVQKEVSVIACGGPDDRQTGTGMNAKSGDSGTMGLSV
jgi:hypothetical protein